MNKHYDFFDQIKDFYIGHGLADAGAFQGLSIEDCERIQTQFNTAFDESLQAYFMVFGKEIEIPKFKGYSLFTVQSFSDAQKVIEQRKKDGNFIINKVLRIVSLDSLTIQELSAPLNSVEVLSYDEIGDCYTLVEKGARNPYIFTYYDNSESLFFQNSRLTEHVRSIFANHIVQYCRDNNWSSSNQVINSLLKLDWIQFYSTIENDNIFWTKKSGHRTRFRYEYEKNIGSAENLLDFNLGEEEFIDYLLRHNCV